MNTIYSLAFWKDAGERAAKSAAQAGVLALGGGAVDVLALDWATFAGAFGGGALLSLLTSIASAGLANRGTASLTKAVEPAA
ncbi:holin [Mycolicibacterium vanbaalenii]|uniref:holin n=1 Tax=Mycolicibacterium vanbaalenii TaxID=110539 RepID=UPI001F400120|nr:holin [Mycolicibacterium vanbaalenii]WND57031.1 holin [Mycolicibacterium vanbaalenii]